MDTPAAGTDPAAVGAATARHVLTARDPGRCLALTFDDGPNPGSTEPLLELLAIWRITATFCVVGERIAAPGGAELLRRTAAAGHTIANHTMTYDDMGDWPADRVRADLVATLGVIRDALGDPEAPVPYFRAPNGSWGVTAAVAAELGMAPLGIGATIEDWVSQDPEVLTDRLRVAVRQGGVVCLHDGGGDRRGTVAALAAVLPELVADGWTFSLPAEHG